MCKPNCNHQKLEKTSAYLLANFFDMIDRILEDGIDEGERDLVTMFILSKVPLVVENAKELKAMMLLQEFEETYDKHMKQKTIQVIDEAFNALKYTDDTNPKF